MKKYFTG